MEQERDFNSLSLGFIEDLYADFLDNPDSVPDDWRAYFARFPGGNGRSGGNGHREPHPTAVAARSAKSRGKNKKKAHGPDPAEMAALQYRVSQLIRNYRVRGHRIARLDPLGMPRRRHPELDPEYHGFTEADMDLRFDTGTLGGDRKLKLRNIIARLRKTYCRSIGVQFMHIDNLSVREWLQERMESTQNSIELSREEQLRILTRLTDAVMFEEFIQKKYVGAKSFSLEGAESLIPLLDLAIENAGEQGIKEIVIGMAHRGRLNVLANIMKKSPRQIFREFEDIDPEMHVGRGDVKYHLGWHCDWETSTGRSVHLALCFNPSHLEFVNPVALGRMRAKQDRLGDLKRQRGMVVLIHGDAAFAGEGIVQETLNLSQLEGYSTGGTLHVVVNNQIGFTTTPKEGRSSTYATDVARMLQIPVFHVNGESPEAVAQVIRLAMEFRRTFKRDVVIDMYCFRRRGHNEGDEPAFTQPNMYRAIRERKSTRDSYLDHLLELGGMTRNEADEIAERRRAVLERELSEARTDDTTFRPSILGRVWKDYKGGPEDGTPEPDTGVSASRLTDLMRRMHRLPEGFSLHPKLQRVYDQRREMGEGKRAFDWATAELLAFATLATEGARLRVSGQDSRRGTFSQRHAVVHDAENGQVYMPLAHLTDTQAPVEIYNSPLSEAGVLGFEYGYSIAYPDGLVIWEAQFGDFVNAAQVIIDQFLVSAEDKWRSLSGLVLLLPHGFEGQGPEHSSARLERFLLLSAEDNIQVVNPSTPAQYFHVLRRQVVRPWRKPLVVMTPKSLLRHPRCVSPFEEFDRGRFRRILPDMAKGPKKPKRILMCSGKIYYELEKERAENGHKNVALLRLEQLYPLPDAVMREALSGYPEGTPLVWVQEEPENMGAWRYLYTRFGPTVLGRHPLALISRPASASPATGSASSHKMEQEEIIKTAFADL